MITPEKIDIVLKNFEKVLPMTEGNREHLLMSEPRVQDLGSNHACGTVHCAAGWYAVSQKDTRRWKYRFSSNEDVGYLWGAHWMAEDLGFKINPLEELEIWASINSEIWGNSLGEAMFKSQWAYGDEEDTRARSLKDIYDHWGRVKSRLQKLKNTQKGEKNDER